MNDLLEKPRKIYVSRSIEFNAAHRLCNPTLTEEENCAIYGKCNNPHGHGHNYLLTITLSGTINRQTGFLFDLKALKAILEEEIVERFDHKHLNYDVPELSNCIPTTEILAVLIWDILAQRFTTINPAITLHEVHLYETGKNAVRYYGE
uniref:6-carboxy-5,6,7,8-tetrahydropterin synthase n=1 Tax=Chlorobium chlorochromatii (strain CaD3) TaxID=340177 RepID=Q3ATM9_CHLCH